MLLRRAMALGLAAGLVLLACGPICGSPVDVDPQACCERHSDCEGMPAERPHSPGPAQCCEQGHDAYPVAKLDGHTALLVQPQAVVARLPEPEGAVLTTAVGIRRQGFGKLAESPPSSLYDLNSSYRI